MTRATTMLAWLLVASGCNKDSGGGSATPAAGSAVATAPAQGSGGGFSADLAKQLDMGGGSSAPAANEGSSANSAAAGSAAGSAAGATTPTAVDPKATSESAVDPKAGSAAGAAVDPKAGSAVTAPDPKAATEPKPAADAKAATEPKPAADAKPGAAEPAKPPTRVVIESGAGPRTPVSVPAELEAITISLLPNWERDVEAAGTISLRVKIPHRTESALFVFRYGYEDASAPTDRDAYKKWLADAKILTPRDDRQKGAAWYIEGSDAKGKPAFRFVVNYGGKKLVCYGSLYKDAASSALGDLRDQTILQAKQICETLAL